MKGFQAAVCLCAGSGSGSRWAAQGAGRDVKMAGPGRSWGQAVQCSVFNAMYDSLGSH